MSQPEQGPIENNENPLAHEIASDAIWVDPAHLWKDNPAAAVFNADSYANMRDNFTFKQFDYPQIVRVETYDIEGNLVIKQFIRDGHTRTKFSVDHPEAVQRVFGRSQIPVRDVTDDILKSHVIVPENERQPGQQGLTMIQYLRTVVPPTIEHSNIAPERIATHLINGWSDIAGADIANRFSAISALGLLQNTNINIATDALLVKFLEGQKEIMSGETPVERQRLNKALLEMASIVRQTRIVKDRVAEAAYMLVATQSPMIGGEKEALRQIYGILHTPAVEARLDGLVLGERETARAEMGQLLLNAFRNSVDRRDRERVVSTVVTSMGDRSFSLVQVKEILGADSPAEKYDQMRKNANYEKAAEAYKRKFRADDLTPTELTILQKLATITYLEERDVDSLIRSVRTGVETLESIDNIKSEIEKTRTELSSRGVNPATIATALTQLASHQATILEGDSKDKVAVRGKNAITAILGIRSGFQREIATYRTGQLVDEFFGAKLADGFGLQIRANIVTYILREVDPTNENSVRIRLDQLSKLAEDLQARVVGGEIRLQVALREQEERKLEAERLARSSATPTVEESPEKQIDDEVTTHVVRPLEPTQPPAVRPSAPLPPLHFTPMASPIGTPQDRVAAEETRKRTNNQRLRQVIQSIMGTLRVTDLETGDLSAETKEVLDPLLREIGRLRFGHPDIVRVVEQDYPRLLREKAEANTAQIIQEEEDTSKDKRTGK